MAESHSINFEAEVKALFPQMTVYNTENPFEREIRLNYFADMIHKTPKQLELKTYKQFQRKTTITATCRTIDFLIFAFCLTQGEEKSIITLQILNMNQRKQCQKTLQTISLKVLSMNMLLDEYQEICLIIGTNCGNLMFYKDFESHVVNISLMKVSSHPIVEIIVSQTLKNIIFILSQNGSIYLINYKQKKIKYQFQASLPMIDDKDVHLFIDELQGYIGCAFSHGRVILWQITAHIKDSLTELTVKKQEEEEDNGYKNFIKKGVKQNSHRRILFKPSASFISLSTQNIRKIGFLGSFIILVTSENILKVIATDLSSKIDSSQMYLVLAEFPLLVHETPQKKIENDQKTPKIETFEEISCILFFSQELLISVNTWILSQNQFVSSRIEKYQFSQELIPFKTILQLPFTTPVIDMLWQEGSYLLCRCQDCYFICQIEQFSKKG